MLIPIMKMRRRPTWSAAAPPMSSRADMQSVYALITHVIEERVAASSDSIFGNATLTN